MKVKSFLKSLIKPICIWIICLVAYFLFALWTQKQVPLISTLFGVKLTLNAKSGFALTMTSIFPMWIVSLLIFCIIYLGIIYLFNHKSIGVKNDSK